MAAGGIAALPEIRPSFREVPLEHVTSESDLQTRSAFDAQQDPEDAELLESVRAVGVRVPVHLQDRGDGTYRIRSGHRRVTAARLAGLTRVPAIVWPEGAEAFDSAVDTWLENLHRKDLSPLERGEMLTLLMKRFELPRSAETASRLGLSKTSFYRYLALKDAPPDVKTALTDGVLGIAQAERIAGIQATDVRATLIQAVKEGVPAKRIDEALEGHRAGAVISRDLLKAGVRSRANGRKGGGHEPDKTWARAKVRELGQSLGLSASGLKPIAAALEARRVNRAHATAAALLVVGGRSGKDALDDAACIERNALKAVETLFTVSQLAESGAQQDTGRKALRKILEVLGVRLAVRRRSGEVG
jgi:ParB/RepB/Spo0J family partition protein